MKLWLVSVDWWWAIVRAEDRDRALDVSAEFAGRDGLGWKEYGLGRHQPEVRELAPDGEPAILESGSG